MHGNPLIVLLIQPPMHESLQPREELIGEVTRLRYTSEKPEELGVGFCSENVGDPSSAEFCQIARLN